MTGLARVKVVIRLNYDLFCFCHPIFFMREHDLMVCLWKGPICINDNSKELTKILCIDSALLCEQEVHYKYIIWKIKPREKRQSHIYYLKELNSTLNIYNKYNQCNIKMKWIFLFPR